MTEVSVIIVTRNTSALTRAAVGSVLNGQDTISKEVIVVDNGSLDDTPSLLPREFPQAKYLRFECNLGFARANNLGVRQATGEFLLLLNSDAQVKPGTLKAAVDWLRSAPHCGIAGAQLLSPGGARQNSIANFPSLATELLNKSLLRRLFPHRFPGKEQRFSEPLEVESIVGAFALIRRTVWERVGGLDERFFFFLEETDFCYQVRAQGWKVVHLPQIEVWHNQGASADQIPVAARIEYWRSRYAYFRKNSGHLTMLILRLGLLCRLTIDGLTSGLLTLFTFGRSARWRSKWHTCLALWLWHLRGYPVEMGLPR